MHQTKLNFNPIIVLFLTVFDTSTLYLPKFQSYYSLISNVVNDTLTNEDVVFQSYYSLISNRPHFFSKRAKTIYNLFIHTLKFVDNKKCFLFICINKQI